MKKQFLLTVTIAAVSCVALATDWTYDAGIGTITDGGWTFAATVKANTTDLTVGSVSVDPGSNATLDFSKPVSDGTTTYTIVKLNPLFKDYANKANLTTLVLPAAGITEISKDAFNGCTGLTSVSPFLPDSITTVGESAFEGSGVSGPLSLLGVVTLNKKAFRSTSITSVTFGSALKTLGAGWGSGCLGYCSQLTSVNFDPNMTGGTINGELVFEGSTKISGTLDMRGFTSLNANRPWYNSASKVKKIIFSSSLSSLSASFFQGQSQLETIEFTGAPPANIATICKAWENSALSGVATVVPYDNKDDWSVYCADGIINDLDSKWSTSYVSTAETKSHYLVYKSAGGGELGDWVFDGTELKSTSQGWAFAATRSANLLTLGGCTLYPSTPGPVDFTTTMTDGDGVTVTVAGFSKLFHDGTGNIAGYDHVTSVAMPTHPSVIGAHSFHGCTALSGAVTLSAGVAEIQQSAFEGCTGITAITLPSGLLTVGANAFKGCTSLVTISPYLPDSVTSIGNSAFRSVPAVADVTALGVVSIEKSGFRNTGITSLRFGPALKSLASGYTDGAICYNTSLTNITFDAAMTNASMSGEHTFVGNSNLTGTMDMRGFKISSANGRPFDGTKVEHVIFNGTGESFAGTMFEQMSALKTVTFLGAPPANAENIFNNHGRSSRLSYRLDVITYIYKAYRTQWLPYAEGGKLDGKRSTWARGCIDESVTDLSKRKLLVLDAPPAGFTVIVY